ncbi:MAG: hypothetical protein PUK40_06385 [Actinomycetaceae bacterium]|nr:hypothetical protein [Arcanobacterium sp.]MDD7505550.1 hypothetical protein [Actinomycetaceae bacterium]
MTSFRVDTTELDHAQGWWRIESATKLPSPSSSRVSLVDVPFMDGAVPVRGGSDVGYVKLSMWVANDPQGHAFEVLQERVSLLGALFDTARELTHTSRSGDVRSVKILACEVGEVNLFGIAGGVVPVTLTVAPFWSSGSTITATRALAAGQKILTEFNGATGVMVDGVITLTGTGANVKLTAPNGSGVLIPSLVEGKPVTIDLQACTVKQGAVNVGYDYPPGGFLRLEPSVTKGAAQTVLTVGGSNLSGVVKVAGKKWVK